MQRTVAVLAALLGFMAGTECAQAVKDVRSILETYLNAMGGARLVVANRPDVSISIDDGGVVPIVEGGFGAANRI